MPMIISAEEVESPAKYIANTKNWKLTILIIIFILI